MSASPIPSKSSELLSLDNGLFRQLLDRAAAGFGVKPSDSKR